MGSSLPVTDPAVAAVAARGVADASDRDAGSVPGGTCGAGAVSADAAADTASGGGGVLPLSVHRLGRGELASLGRNELIGVLDDIERLTNRLAGYRVEVLDALDQLSRAGIAPDASPHLSLRDATGVSERDARRMVRVAEKVRSDEAVLAALSDGDVTPAQAEALCDARVPDAVRASLTSSAASEDTDQTRRRIRQAEAEHVTETPMERFERQRQARGAGWQRDHEGMLKLWARFDPHTGAQIEAMLEPLRRELWQDDRTVRSGRRSPAQRDADTLAYALAGITATDADAAAVDRLHARGGRKRRSAEDRRPSRRITESNGDGRQQPGRITPTDGGWDADGRLPPAQISVLIDLDALRGQTDEMGLTDAGTELPPEVVRAHACDARIIPMILNGPGGSADVGRCQRTVSLRLRRLLVARDHHCRWPGCHAPPSRCDAHHVIHWLDGGPTNLDNLVLLCHRHHHQLHQCGYRMVPLPDGTWTVAQEAEPQRAPRRGKPQARAP